MFGEMFIILRVRRTSGIINISPNTNEIFHSYFENKCNFLLVNIILLNILMLKYFLLYFA